jgi:hypothetical protein
MKHLLSIICLERIFINLLIFSVFLTSRSCEDIFKLPAPETPIINKLGIITINSIDLFWSEYKDDGFNCYEVYYGPQFTANYNLYSTIKNRHQVYITVSGLTPLTTYQFFVRTIDKEAHHADSKIITLTTLSDIPSLVYFDNIADSNILAHSIRISWNEYKDDYAVDFSRYELTYSTSKDFPDDNRTKKEIFYQRDPAFVVIDLTESTGYYFKIRTYNTLNKFSESSVLYLETDPCPPDVPYLYVTDEVTDTTAEIYWTNYTDTGFVRYDIHLDTFPTFKPDSLNFIASVYNKEQTTYKLNNLKPTEEYFVKLKSVKNNSAYSISNYIGFTAYPGGGPVPVTIWGSASTTNTITIFWTESISRYLVGYTAFFSTTEGFIPELNNAFYFNASNLRAKLEGLKSKTQYFFRVRVINKMGKFNYSNELGVSTK